MAESGILPVNLVSLDPEEQNEANEEAGKYYAERYREFQEALVKQGALTFEPGKPAASWQDYMRRTLVADIPSIMDPDYLEKRRAGQAGPLQAEVLMQQRIQAEQQFQQQQAEYEAMAGEGAMVPPPQQPQLGPEPPMLWPMLLPYDLSNGATVFNDFFFNYHAAEFRRLMDAQVKREQGIPDQMI